MWKEDRENTEPTRRKAVVLTYPHYRPSLEPRPMRASEVWRVAQTAREQICTRPRRPKVDLAELTSRCRRFRVNGASFAAHWEYGEAVRDEAGVQVLGATEHDPRCPDTALIQVNGRLIGDREHLTRSTAAHELGHAVFDTPSWTQRTRQTELDLPGRSGRERRFQASETTGKGRDWREWRANEFMGGFLVPRALLHGSMVKTAAAIGCPLAAGACDIELPVLDAGACNDIGLMALVIELADRFGVSDAFMRVRLDRYALLRR